MKITAQLLILCGALLAPAALAADAFEGKISLVLTAGKGRGQTLDLAIKNKLQRIDMTAGNGQRVSSIVNLSQHEITVILPEQRLYMTIPIQEAEAAAQQRAAHGQLEKTGQTDKILGYVCELFTLKENGKTTELWLADGLGSFMGLGGGNPFGGRPTPKTAWEQALAGKTGFPLRVIERAAGGKENSRMEVTKIDPSPLPDSLFAPPADYQRFEMPAGLPGMPQGGGMNPFGGGRP